MRHLYYPRCETLNRWRSFDAHFEDGAGSVLLLVLPIKEANTSVMTICKQCPLWLPWMQNLISLTICWHSFPGWGREHLATQFDHKDGHYIQKEPLRTIVDISQLTLEYLNATINRTSRKENPQIGPDGFTQTQWNPRLDGYGAGFGPPSSGALGYRTVLQPNCTVCPFQPLPPGGLPGLVADTSPDKCAPTWFDNPGWNQCDWQVRLRYGLWLWLALTRC